MSRQGRALNGLELASGLVSLIESKVGPLAAEAAEKELERQWWPALHLTFPRVQIEWCDCQWLDGSPGIWLRCLYQSGKEWEFRWNDEAADIREMQKLGPFSTPDDFREALGLPRTAQFRMPDGAVVTAELPGQSLRQREKSAEEVLPEVPQLVARPSEDLEVVRKEASEAVDRLLAGTPKEEMGKASLREDFPKAETPSEELLAEPPTVELTPAPPKPIEAPKRAGLRTKVAKGGKK